MSGKLSSGISRRGFLAGTSAALLAGAARSGWAVGRETGEAVLRRTGLSGVSAFALADPATGQLLEASAPHRGLPPASVAKILTALYALDTLGDGFAFETGLIATGPIEDGTLNGDLVLAGGGDPTLDTDGLGEMAARLEAAGVRAVRGRFLVAHGTLPSLSRIEPGQPDHAAYNPAVSGMNLNFNRVHLEWAPGAKGPDLGFAAPGVHHKAAVEGFGAEIGGRTPRHRWQDGREVWTVPQSSIAGRGGVWLPVRAPARYSGRVFGVFAAQRGIDLPEPELVELPPAGTVLVSHASSPLGPVVRDMLRYSTNLTAEVAGLHASFARGALPHSLDASGSAMAAWAAERYGPQRGFLVNHSGLSARSTATAADLVAVLAAERARLPAYLRERPILDARGNLAAPRGVRMVAKTGTMYFVSALAGYLQGRQGRMLAFAILSADLDHRAAMPPGAQSRPPGARSWGLAARGQQNALLRLWAERLGESGALRPLPRPAPAAVDTVSQTGAARL
jgi:D-alanyl-D-alanine carboxypeptidase/D-alanyl-D-alanine-endopeptidase (penicillin-binding protein 4)